MKTAIFKKPGLIAVEDHPKPTIQQPTDAVMRVVRACVCGSDLWYYRGDSEHGQDAIGHEAIGVVEEIGDDVTTMKPGDLVIVPFAFSDNTCPHCENGVQTACQNGGFFGAENPATAARPNTCAFSRPMVRPLWSPPVITVTNSSRPSSLSQTLWAPATTLLLPLV